MTWTRSARGNTKDVIFITEYDDFDEERDKTIVATVAILKLLEDDISVDEIVKEVDNVSLEVVLDVKARWIEVLIEDFVESSFEKNFKKAQETLGRIKSLAKMTNRELAARIIEKYYDKKFSIAELAEVCDLKVEDVTELMLKFECVVVFTELHEMLTKMHISDVLEKNYVGAERTLKMLKENDEKIKKLKGEMYSDSE